MFKCHISGCENIGTALCRWRSNWRGANRPGGCGKLYCRDHTYQKVDAEKHQRIIVGKSKRQLSTRQTNSKGSELNENDFECCTACADLMENDHATDKINKKIVGCNNYFIVIIGVCSVLGIVLLLIILVILINL